MRALSLKLHLWVGLLAAVFLFVEGMTGGILAWGPDIIRALNAGTPRVEPAVYRVPSGPPALPLTQLVATLEKSHAGRSLTTLRFPAQPDLAWETELKSRTAAPLTVWFDPHTGATLAERVQDFHGTWLETLVGASNRLHGNIAGSVALILLASSGLILWWPRKIFGPRQPGSVFRLNFDLHNAIGFYSSLFLLLFSFTAIIMSAPRPSIAFLRFITRTPLPASLAAAQPAAPPVTRPPQSAERLDLDAAMAAATQATPGARITVLRRLNDGDKVVAFTYELPGATPPQVGHIIVNPVTRAVQVQPPSGPRRLDLSEKIVRVWANRVHTGDIFGQPTRWIAGFFSFMLALLAATGPAIWWLRRRGNRSTPPTA